MNDKALLSCMMYVDLSPIRASMAKTPEQSEFTSIYERIQQMAEPPKRGRPKKIVKATIGEEGLENTPSASLSEFGGQVPKKKLAEVIPFNYIDYFVLLDWTGRAVRGDKRGAIPSQLILILGIIGVRVKLVDEIKILTALFYSDPDYYLTPIIPKLFSISAYLSRSLGFVPQRQPTTINPTYAFKYSPTDPVF